MITSKFILWAGSNNVVLKKASKMRICANITTRGFIQHKVHKCILNSENSKNHVIVSFLVKNCDYIQIYNMVGSNIVVL